MRSSANITTPNRLRNFDLPLSPTPPMRWKWLQSCGFAVRVNAASILCLVSSTADIRIVSLRFQDVGECLLPLRVLAWVGTPNTVEKLPPCQDLMTYQYYLLCWAKVI
jgi:hypothetical protein